MSHFGLERELIIRGFLIFSFASGFYWMAAKGKGDVAMAELPKIMHYAAKKAETRAGFLAVELATYRTHQGLNNEELAARLGISLDSLTQLALCKKPSNQVELARIADFVGADLAVLTQICQLQQSEAES